MMRHESCATKLPQIKIFGTLTRILTNNSGYRSWSNILNTKLDKCISTFVNTKKNINWHHEITTRVVHFGHWEVSKSQYSHRSLVRSVGKVLPRRRSWVQAKANHHQGLKIQCKWWYHHWHMAKIFGGGMKRICPNETCCLQELRDNHYKRDSSTWLRFKCNCLSEALLTWGYLV